jgi:hypothetical protein
LLLALPAFLNFDIKQVRKNNRFHSISRANDRTSEMAPSRSLQGLDSFGQREVTEGRK